MDDKGITPRFEFGFGLSYTTFAYSSLSISSSSDIYVFSFTVTNSGVFAGTEKPQLYLAYPAAAGEPKRVLRGFEEVDLGVGQSKEVSIVLDRRGMRCVYRFFSILETWAKLKIVYGIHRARAMCDRLVLLPCSLVHRYETLD